MVDKITTPITQTGVITKINELIDSSIVVDSVISSSSENPVQNKIIYQALTAKADATVIPTKTSDLINDSHFIQTINVNGTAQSVSISTVDLTIPTTAADIGAQVPLIAGTDIEIVNFLPSGYTQLEYIETTGTQYIDTGVNANSDYSVDIVFTTPSTLSNGSLFGNQNGDVLLYLSNTSFKLYNNNSDKGVLTGSVSANTTYNIKLTVSGTTATITGDLTGTFTGLTITGAYNILLGANHNASGNVTDFGKFKYNSVKITKDSVLAFGNYPAKDSSDNVGIYDSVTNSLKQNAGTGSFIAGNEVNYQKVNFTNDSGFITGITSSDVTTALGYTPYDSSNPSGYTSNIGTVTGINNVLPDSNGSVTLTASDVGALPDTTTIGAGFTTFKVNGTTVGTIGANQTTNSTIDMTVTASVTVDQTYNASSTYPQSGTAVAQAISSTSLTATYTSVTETLSLSIS